MTLGSAAPLRGKTPECLHLAQRWRKVFPSGGATLQTHGVHAASRASFSTHASIKMTATETDDPVHLVHRWFLKSHRMVVPPRQQSTT